MRNKRKKGMLWISMGLLLIAASLLLICYNLYDGNRAAKATKMVAEQLLGQIPSQEDRIEGEIPDYQLDPNRELPTVEIDGRNYVGVIEIPAYQLSLPVQEAWSYQGLRISPCRYEGSPYTDDLVIAAHNYTAHFGRLHHLQEGEEIVFTDMEGNSFRYVLEMKENLRPTQVEEMNSGTWDLTLFTCTFDDRYRTAFRCRKIKELAE